ncbi:glycerophosphoryl diester phosphodiesterase [Paenibacillus sp. UNCCL117]|uniref:glycerophosphodiester phosphodiesterase n=1 Tax=unclassified Paenibacillus TaxID=185978 RepID=UPI00088508A1|nr:MULTISPECIES: glycerophosphodiester phosphodiesterase family protein [unclassified Paenibacillus]SDD11957.1 glycerophosphoryl diester phosphodiesterase [Paenibacillus sp. cl123]SFW33691.1 glycerophosphoryl diester phosphodiesterase [Paenibacillus sp. UNCCL117]
MTIRGMAHRGYPRRYPENTLSSFQAACELSYSHLELDVQLSKDGIPVVIHDTSVDRMTDGKGQVKDFTLAELKELTIGEGERIPTLDEALDLLKGRLIVDIELKQMGPLYPGLEEAVLDAVKRKQMQEQVFLTSFDHYSLTRIRELDDKIGIGMINSGASPAFFPFAKEIGCGYMSIHYPYLNDEFIRRCEQEQIGLIAWTVDSEQDMRQMLRYPSLLICTNELDRWASVSGQRNQSIS